MTRVCPLSRQQRLGRSTSFFPCLVSHPLRLLCQVTTKYPPSTRSLDLSTLPIALSRNNSEKPFVIFQAINIHSWPNVNAILAPSPMSLIAIMQNTWKARDWLQIFLLGYLVAWRLHTLFLFASIRSKMDIRASPGLPYKTLRARGPCSSPGLTLTSQTLPRSRSHKMGSICRMMSISISGHTSFSLTKTSFLMTPINTRSNVYVDSSRLDKQSRLQILIIRTQIFHHLTLNFSEFMQHLHECSTYLVRHNISSRFIETRIQPHLDGKVDFGEALTSRLNLRKRGGCDEDVPLSILRLQYLP